MQATSQPNRGLAYRDPALLQSNNLILLYPFPIVKIHMLHSNIHGHAASPEPDFLLARCCVPGCVPGRVRSGHD